MFVAMAVPSAFMLPVLVVSALSSTSSMTSAAFRISVRLTSGSIAITASSSSVRDHGISAMSSCAVMVCLLVAAVD